jgi:hypothetical protein
VQTLEHTQLPLKFKRPTLDDAEINAINVFKSKLIIWILSYSLKYFFFFQSGGAE